MIFLGVSTVKGDTIEKDSVEIVIIGQKTEAICQRSEDIAREQRQQNLILDRLFQAIERKREEEQISK